MRRFWRVTEALAWAAFFALAAGALVLRYWLLPDVERYRGEIVARVAAAVGQPVKIGGIEAGWHGLRPHIGLRDVRIYDAAGREALVLPSVDNIISWRSLVYRDLRLHSLVIEGPRLAVRRDAAGVLYVAGIKLSGTEADPAASDWLLGQEEIEIRNAEIEWHDERRGAPPLTLAALNLRLRNSGDVHELGLSARPPAELGSGFELRARLAGRSVADIDAWSGRVYLELGYTDLAAWRAWVDYPVDVRRGHGALRLWMTLVGGEARAATADVALARLQARLGRELQPLELSFVQGRLNARVDGDAYELAGRELALVAEQGPKMQPTDFQLRWQPAAAGRAESGALAARLLELEPLAQLVESLPLPAELRGVVAELAPRGRLTEAKLDWQGELASPQRFNARARFADLALRPRDALPGFAGMTGSLEATESAGRVHVLAKKASIELPKVLPEPVVGFDTLTAQLDWERHGERHVLRLSGGQFANAHFAGSAAGSWSTPGSGRGAIDLTASLSRGDGAQVARYLPHPAIMGPKTREWLARAIVAGTLSEAQLRLRGDLIDFPFVNPLSGIFTVSGRFRDGVLDYFDGWPRIHDIDGQLLFEREKMEIVGRSGTLLGAKLSGVRAAVANLDVRSPLLTITGQAEGPTAEFLRFVETSPVRGMTEGLAAGIEASGRGRLQLRLELPLNDPAPARVAGDYDFTANNVVVQPRLPQIERASGRVSFTDSGFALHDVRGRIFGGAVAINGGSRPGAGIEVLARGEAQVAALGGLFEHPWKAHLSGGAPYAATVSLREGLTRISIESSLRGVGIALPAPLDKPAADALPLRVDVIPVEGGARERVSVRLGGIAAAEFLRRRQDEAIGTQRAAIWLSPSGEQAVRLPERPGTLIYGSLPELDLDRWMPLFSSEDAAAAAASFDVSLGVLDVYGKRIRKASLKAGADAAGWSASVEAEELAGRLSYRKEGGGHLVARLAHFTLPQDSPTPRAGGTARPRELPGLDLVAERVTFRGKELGRVEMAASRAGEDWRIDRLTAVNPDYAFTGKGVWAGSAAGPPRSTINYELKASDIGRFLDRIGYKDLVKGGKADLQGTLSWLGEPSVIDYPSLSGSVKLDAENGQFLEIEPGIGKLIALMSMQQFFKRITLDFRDVFSKGFAFDRIEATSRIERGIMELKEKEFRMRGPAAEVEMSGIADLARETQNLRVRVVPSLSGSATTVVTIVNPIAGVAAAIAQSLMKNPLGQIFSYDYAVTGSWSDPKVAKLSAAPSPLTTPEQSRP